MALVYGLVARGTTVLVEYLDEREAPESINSDGQGGFPQAPKIARYILQEKVAKRPGPHKRSFGHQRHNFYYLVDDFGLCFMVVVQKVDGDSPSVRIPYQCIEDISSEFMANCGGQYQSAGEGGLNDIFARTIQQKLQLWNDPNTDTLKQAVGKVDDVKKQMVDNIDKVVKRGEAVDSLEERASLLSNDAAEYKVNVITMQRKIWWKQKKFQIMGGVCCIIVTIIVIILIVLAIC
eukprot:CAMPEP_0201501084 /NCGR_PEP_ID=MMETSP0151_2-20130828/83397_1 /ASSEMBLY_ACC=CAM_ASM_000257 /TAXON_ID=200890 /ORGANISM="Paramoeba atlantica, Strain 621/1 / CCAP 1560/9" /LENGTH=234 /DNA_ID=CAMNT_0047894559 /DNA_START=376 /DNA_END=1080 /DNA_ORIENTATION=-